LLRFFLPVWKNRLFSVVYIFKMYYLLIL
jgi:hypothetical protein